jgi:hypothetical protein
MKQFICLLAALAVAATSAFAAEKVEAGPRKGRLLKLESANAEFFIEKDRTVSIAFYDAAKKQIAPADQVLTATAEAPSGKTKLEFARKGDLLVSTAALPEGEQYNIVLQARESAGAKPKNFRIKLDLNTCKACDHPEYACICESH